MKEIYDFIVVGSGAGSVPAALVMAKKGYSVAILEKLPHFGGTTAFSGGVVWLPKNSVGTNAGSASAAVDYLLSVAGESISETTDARRQAFIEGGDEMLKFLTDCGLPFIDAQWPDYHDEMTGGLASGRSLTVPMFDANILGEWKSKLARYPLTFDLPIATEETAKLLLVKRSWSGKKNALKFVARILANKLLRKDVKGAGPALQARLLELALKARVAIKLQCAVVDLVSSNGRVTGVVCTENGEQNTILARRGVLINAGGFARNQNLREKYLPQPTSSDWTQTNVGDTGDLIQPAQALGAQLKMMDSAWWLPSSFYPDGTFAGFHSPNDIAKPHCIVVNQEGVRFANEAEGYVEFGQAMYRSGSVPAWAVFDHQHRSQYPWGQLVPGWTPKKAIANGYLIKANSLAELASKTGINADNLQATVTQFNQYAKDGVDQEFQRGVSQYNQYYGDPSVTPNGNLGALYKAPFYAVKLLPADVGTAGGLAADEWGRVLREDGSAIDGLYVTGNSSAAVVGKCYPGAGASIGPSMVFGYLAAKHAAHSI